LLHQLNKVRRQTLPNFDKIYLSRQAVFVLANIFLNPDCQATISLYKFLDKPRISLSELSQNIVTAAPVTLAQYANRHNRFYITREDIIKCFSLDHFQDLTNKGIDSRLSAAYALSHLLTPAKIIKVHKYKNSYLADLQVNFNRSVFYFNKVALPPLLGARKGELVWHHFGVVVDKCSSSQDKDLLEAIRRDQLNFLSAKWLPKTLAETSQEIDFSKKSIFQRDLIGKIIKNSDKQ